VITILGITALLLWLGNNIPEPQTAPQNFPNVKVKKTLKNGYIDNMAIAMSPIETAIRKQIKKPEGVLTNLNFGKVRELDLRRYELKNVHGLKKLTKLVNLHLGHNQVTDVTDLENLMYLSELSLSCNNLTEIPNGLERITQLKVLYLDDNELTDVKGLEKLKQLEQLSLKANPDLTIAQINELQKALPRCEVYSNPTK